MQTVRFPDGHVFKPSSDGRLAVSDSDEEAWFVVDESRPVEFDQGFLMLPLAGGYRSPCSAEEALWLASVRGMKLRVGGGDFALEVADA